MVLDNPTETPIGCPRQIQVLTNTSALLIDPPVPLMPAELLTKQHMLPIAVLLLWA